MQPGNTDDQWRQDSSYRCTSWEVRDRRTSVPHRHVWLAHIVGGFPLESSKAVFETPSSSLPPGCHKRIPDGETGSRHYLVVWQSDPFKDAGLAHLLSNTMEPNGFRLDHTAKEINATMSHFPTLETDYDTVVIDSYAEFRRLKDAGTTSKHVRSQVCIPSATNFVAINVQPAFQGPFEPHCEAAFESGDL